MITELPTDNPVRFPVVPTMATAVLLLLHVPVEGISLSVDAGDPLRQRLVVPLIALIAGNALTETVLIAVPWQRPLV